MSAASMLLVVAVVTLAILLVGVRVVGLTPYAVLSGSMEPVYHVGSLIYVRTVDPDTIQVQTPITFTLNGNGGVVATHRVVDVIRDGSGYAFITKGDANQEPDGRPVKPENVIGVPVFSIPYLGYFSNWLQSGAGMIAGVALAAALLLSTLLAELWPKADKPPVPTPAVREAAKPAPVPESPAQEPDQSPGEFIPQRRRRSAKYTPETDEEP